MHTHIYVYWRKQWHPTPVLLPGKSHGWRSLWAAVHGVTKSRTRLNDFTFTFHFHALEKEMAAHSSVLAWRNPGTGEPGGLLSMGSHRVGHDWSDLAAAAAGTSRTQTVLVLLFTGSVHVAFVVVFHLLSCLFALLYFAKGDAEMEGYSAIHGKIKAYGYKQHEWVSKITASKETRHKRLCIIQVHLLKF